MQFRNSAEIKTYYSNQLKTGNQSIISKLNTYNNKPYTATDEDLLNAANELKEYIQKWIEQYYIDFPENSNSSVFSNPNGGRTDGLKRALRVDIIRDDKKYGRDKYIALYFDPSESWSQSFVPNTYPDSYPAWKPWLINEGWKVRKDVFFKNYYRVGWYEGYHFIEKGLEDWKANSKYADIVDVKRVGIDTMRSSWKAMK